MPEGPSIVIAKEQLQQFTGKKILSASGSSKIDMSRLTGNRIRRVTSWGKHLLFCFNDFSIRIHFLMFGKYLINSTRELRPRLSLKFEDNQEFNLYSAAVSIINEPLDEVYDWSADIMNDDWDPAAARKKLKAASTLMIADVLMDQNVFSGLGNIIKNEVLYRTKIHPASITGKIPPARRNALLKEIRKYAFEFLEWRKQGKLASHWEAYKKKICVRDGTPMKKEYFGTAERRSFFCETCQVLYI